MLVEALKNVSVLVCALSLGGKTMKNTRRDLLRTPEKEIPICEVFRDEDGYVFLRFKHGSAIEVVALDVLLKLLLEKA